MMAALKKFYRLFALLAVLHVLAAGGLIAYVALTGRLTPDRVRAAIDAFRANDLQPDESAAEPPMLAGNQTDNTESARTVAPDPQEEQIRRLNLERVRTHAQQQLILANRQLVEVRREREEFEKMIAEQSVSRKEQEKEVRSDAFEKELEIVSQLKPPIALDRLLLLPPDDAARLLMNMDTRKSKKIIEAAHKDDGKWMRIIQIQERMGELSPLQDANATEEGSALAGGRS